MHFPRDGLTLSIYGNSGPDLEELHLWEFGYTPGCSTLIPEDIEPLHPVRVTPRVTRETIGPQDGISYATPKWNLSDESGRNRAWTIDDTVATNETYSLILTIEFLNGDAFPDEREQVKNAALDWATTANITYKFIDNLSSEKSDIRVLFKKPTMQDVLEGKVKDPHVPSINVGAPQTNLQAHWASNAYTMFLPLPLSDGTALHELGHALGLLHEHQHPGFKEHFNWKGATEKETIGLIAGKYERDANNKEVYDNLVLNFLAPVGVADAVSTFDIESVMLYDLWLDLIVVRPDAPLKIKSVVEEAVKKGERTLPVNDMLSGGDRQFMTEIYGTVPNQARLSGSVRIEGKDE